MLNNYYLINVILLIVFLFYPVNKLIFVLSIRRLEKKTGKSLNKEEKYGQLKRSRFISLVLLIIFSCLFNINLININ